MDPDEALKQTLTLMRNILTVHDDGGSDSLLAGLGVELALLFHGLDGWLERGGFLPARWAEEATR